MPPRIGKLEREKNTLKELLGVKIENPHWLLGVKIYLGFDISQSLHLIIILEPGRLGYQPLEI